MKFEGVAKEMAEKEAVTDGLKRALRCFGNMLGNCLYDTKYTEKLDTNHRKTILEPITYEMLMQYLNGNSLNEMECEKEKISMCPVDMDSESIDNDILERIEKAVDPLIEKNEAIVIEENKETETLEVNSQQILPNVDLKQNETSEVVRKEEIVEEKKPRMSSTTSSGKKILFNAPLVS